MAEITLVEAVNQALAYEMEANPDVIVMGEDVAKNGGVFRATVGLLDKFGAERVLDTPLAESMMQLNISMAHWIKTVANFPLMGFIYPALDGINHASRMRNRTRGMFDLPSRLSYNFGAGIHAQNIISHRSLFCAYSWFACCCTLFTIIAYVRLHRFVRSVIFLEPSRLYRYENKK